MTGSLPAASFPKSFPVSQESHLRSSAAFAPKALGEPGVGISGWPGDRVPPLPLASRRPLRERRVAAGASRSPHQAHVGQPRAREPEDRRDARSCERGCGPSRLCGPLARASRLDPPRHGGRRGGRHPWLRSSAQRDGLGLGSGSTRSRSDPLGHLASTAASELTRLGRTHPLSATQEHGSMEGRPVVRESTLTELQSKSASAKASASAEATADKPRQALPGRSEPRARMRGIPHKPRRREESPAHSASSRTNRLTSPSGRSMPTIRATSGG